MGDKGLESLTDIKSLQRTIADQSLVSTVILSIFQCIES